MVARKQFRRFRRALRGCRQGRDLGYGGVEQLDERHPGHHLAPIPGQIIAFIKSD